VPLQLAVLAGASLGPSQLLLLMLQPQPHQVVWEANLEEPKPGAVSNRNISNNKRRRVSSNSSSSSVTRNLRPLQMVRNAVDLILSFSVTVILTTFYFAQAS
jgi:hypothetical protein